MKGPRGYTYDQAWMMLGDPIQYSHVIYGARINEYSCSNNVKI